MTVLGNDFTVWLVLGANTNFTHPTTISLMGVLSEVACVHVVVTFPLQRNQHAILGRYCQEYPTPQGARASGLLVQYCGHGDDFESC